MTYLLASTVTIPTELLVAILTLVLGGGGVGGYLGLKKRSNYDSAAEPTRQTAQTLPEAGLVEMEMLNKLTRLEREDDEGVPYTYCLFRGGAGADTLKRIEKHTENAARDAARQLEKQDRTNELLAQLLLGERRRGSSEFPAVKR